MASGAAVITLGGDPLVAVVTFAAAAQTGSSQRMSEGVHSVTDLMCDPRSMHQEGAPQCGASPDQAAVGQAVRDDQLRARSV